MPLCPVPIVAVSSKKRMNEREVVPYLIRQSELSRLVMVEGEEMRNGDGRSKKTAKTMPVVGWLGGVSPLNKN